MGSVGFASYSCCVPWPSWVLECGGHSRGLVKRLWVGAQADMRTARLCYIFIPFEGSGQAKVIMWEVLGYFSWLGAHQQKGDPVLSCKLGWDQSWSPSYEPQTRTLKQSQLWREHPAHWKQLAVAEPWKN